MHVTIGLLAWNNWDDTADCLTTLAACEGGFDILVIDNGSTDGTPERAQEQFPRVEVLSLGENLGVAGGYNRSMAHAFARGAGAVLLLNNDTLAGPTLVTDMVKVAELTRQGFMNASIESLRRALAWVTVEDMKG